MLAIPFKLPDESPWPALAVALAVVGMLVVFHAVVSGAVQAGEARRQAKAQQTAAVLRCNALPKWHQTRACLKELGAKVSAEEPTMFATR